MVDCSEGSTGRTVQVEFIERVIDLVGNNVRLAVDALSAGRAAD